MNPRSVLPLKTFTRFAVPGLALLLTACGDAVGPEVDPSFEIVEGEGLSHIIGCAAPVAVKLDGVGSAAQGATVTFTVADGGGSVTPTQAVIGADGIARATWTLGGGANTLTASVTEPTTASVTLNATGVPVAPGGFAAVGNKIVRSTDCQPHRFYGVSRVGLEWASGENRLSSTALAAADFDAIRSWEANVVRLPISQAFWTPGSIHYNPKYPALIERLVGQARERGLSVILDLHTSDRGDPNYSGLIELQQMPDVERSIPFWKDVAAKFKHDGGVIFELYNEPNGVTWDVWLNGGDIPGGPAYGGDPYGVHKKAYRAAGMQQLYDAVRSTGAHNLVIVGGTHWGFFLDKIGDHRIQGGYNIAYATHPYDYPDKQPASWDAAFGTVLDKYPVIISEFGIHGCDRFPYIQSVLDYADKYRLSWVAWAWWTPSASDPNRAELICEFPALISDWNGTPSAMGEMIRSRIQSY